MTDKTPDFEALLRMEEERLAAQLQTVRLALSHGGEKGRGLEHQAMSLVRSFLPAEYGLATGFIAATVVDRAQPPEGETHMSLRDPNPSRKSTPKRVAIVIANPATSSTTGWPVGFWWSELTHPYLAFHEVGYEVEVFSPFGGKCEADGMSDPRDASGYSAGPRFSPA